MMKSKKTNRKIAHTPKSPIGMGDFYGTGIKQKMGRNRDVTGLNEVSPKKMKVPPKSLA